MARCLLVACLLSWCASCVGVSTDFEYPADLASPNPVQRTLAAREFALRRDRARAPVAFCLLRDSEAQVRLLVYEALKDMSPDGEDLGYRPHLEEDVRNGTSVRWEAWWRSREEPRAGEAPGG